MYLKLKKVVLFFGISNSFRYFCSVISEMAGKGMLAEKSGDWLYLLELDVYYVSLLIYWKLGTSSDLSERDGSGRLHNVYIYTAQVRPFV